MNKSDAEKAGWTFHDGPNGQVTVRKWFGTHYKEATVFDEDSALRAIQEVEQTVKLKDAGTKQQTQAAADELRAQAKALEEA